jgi:hypothetical protein
MPGMTDGPIKMMAMAQRVIRGEETNAAVTSAQQRWMQEHKDDPAMLTDRTRMDEYIQAELDRSSRSLFPEVVAGSDNFIDDMLDNIDSGNINRTTIIRYVNAGGTASYAMAGDVLKTLLPDNQDLLPASWNK